MGGDANSIWMDVCVPQSAAMVPWLDTSLNHDANIPGSLVLLCTNVQSSYPKLPLPCLQHIVAGETLAPPQVTDDLRPSGLKPLPGINKCRLHLGSQLRSFCSQFFNLVHHNKNLLYNIDETSGIFGNAELLYKQR